MRDYLLPIIGVVAVIVVVAIFYVIRSKKKANACPIDLDILMKALGGKNNITDVESGPTRLKVRLLDDEQLDIQAIKDLGASGIVQGHNSLTMIFGKAAGIIEYELSKKLK